jgi:hypothetical protein
MGFNNFVKKSNNSNTSKPSINIKAAIEELTHFGTEFEDLGVPLNGVNFVIFLVHIVIVYFEVCYSFSAS